jgi:radical SAM protein with 4Fe4S-binding SPASM domain
VFSNKSDNKAILKKQTLKKVWNIGKLYASFLLSRLLKIPITWGKPSSISIEPTTACNLGCPECPSGLNKTIIDELGAYLSFINFYFQGEPFINPDFLKLVNYASDSGIYTGTSTNAHFITEEVAKKTIESGLDRLIISIDGTTQEVYEQYRIHGTLEKVLEGTKNIVKWKKELKSSTPHVIFQFLVVKPNEHQIKDAVQLAEEMGVDEIKFKTAQVYNFKDGNPLIPEQEKYSRYKKKKDGTFVLKNKMSNHCWRMWSGCVITWDGKIVPCCFDKDASHQLGSISEQTFSSIWQSNEYNHFRKSVLSNRKEIDICKNCSEGSKVWT